jgi:hypothetical protein
LKGQRTKAQEIVADLFGPGKYIVREEDLPRLAEHFQSFLPELLTEKYVDVVLAYITGKDVGNLDRQIKHHAIQMLQNAIRFFPSAEPTFLSKVELTEGKTWSKAALAEVLFGEHGDPKIYIANIPEPVDGKAYTKPEVENILTTF